MVFLRRRRENFGDFEHEIFDFPFEITLKEWYFCAAGAKNFEILSTRYPIFSLKSPVKSDFFLAAAGGQPPETMLAQISQISRSQIFLRRGGFRDFSRRGGFRQDLD